MVEETNRIFSTTTTKSKDEVTRALTHQGKLNYGKLTNCVAVVYKLYNHSKAGCTSYPQQVQNNDTAQMIKDCQYTERMGSECAVDKSVIVTECRKDGDRKKCATQESQSTCGWKSIEECEPWLALSLTGVAPQLV